MRALSLALLVIWIETRAVACDLALALAIDVSGSVDVREHRLQMEGLAAALRAPDVQDALISARAAILVVQWTGNGRQEVTVPWRRISGGADIDALADAVAAAPRPWRHYSTAIGEALRFTAGQFMNAPVCTRRVIDVSSDGRSNEGEPVEERRARLIADGFTINGLAIEGSEPDLSRYFQRYVIGGPGAFVVTANGYEDYPRQIRRKLYRETAERLAARE